MLLEHNAVLLLAEHFERGVVVGGCDDYLKEYLVDGLGCGQIYDAVSDKHASECRYGISREGCFPCFEHGGTGGQSAGVVVFEDGECRFGEFGHEVDRRVDVKQVVVGDLFAVNLIENFAETAVECAVLVGVFAVAHVFLSVDSYAQIILAAAACEIVVDVGVVAR